jgi:peptide/nickel transport system permease protein
MIVFILKRLVLAIPVLFAVSFIAFALVRATPGDPASAIAGDNATPERIEQIHHLLGLDRPIGEAYVDWIGRVFHGDLGTSMYRSTEKVTDDILDRFPVTFSVAIGAIGFAALIGLPAGILAATTRRRWVDRVATTGATLGIALPSYFVALLLVLVTAIWNRWLPATGYVPFADDPWQWAQHLILPWIALGLVSGAIITRQLRAAFRDTMQQDYILTLRSGGLRERTVVFKHGLRNSIIPVITVFGLQFAYLLGGTIIIESIFAIPGLGSLAINSVSQSDYPLIQGVIMTFTVVVVLVNLLVDVSYAYFNPKVRV